MTEIVAKERICLQADEAAKLAARTGIAQTNPYPPASEAAARWNACYCRYLLLHSSPESEASA